MTCSALLHVCLKEAEVVALVLLGFSDSQSNTFDRSEAYCSGGHR